MKPTSRGGLSRASCMKPSYIYRCTDIYILGLYVRVRVCVLAVLTHAPHSPALSFRIQTQPSSIQATASTTTTTYSSTTPPPSCNNEKEWRKLFSIRLVFLTSVEALTSTTYSYSGIVAACSRANTCPQSSGEYRTLLEVQQSSPLHQYSVAKADR